MITSCSLGDRYSVYNLMISAGVIRGRLGKESVLNKSFPGVVVKVPLVSFSDDLFRVRFEACEMVNQITVVDCQTLRLVRCLIIHT